MARFALYLVLFLLLTGGGLLLQEFWVGLQLYQTISSPSDPIARITTVAAPQGSQTARILRIESRDASTTSTVTIPLYGEKFSLHYDAIVWRGLGKSIGGPDRLKLMAVHFPGAQVPSLQALRVNGGRDPCWQLVDLVGGLGLAAARGDTEDLVCSFDAPPPPGGVLLFLKDGKIARQTP